jgi:hypothetical protein
MCVWACLFVCLRLQLQFLLCVCVFVFVFVVVFVVVFVLGWCMCGEAAWKLWCISKARQQKYLCRACVLTSHPHRYFHVICKISTSMSRVVWLALWLPLGRMAALVLAGCAKHRRQGWRGACGRVRRSTVTRQSLLSSSLPSA